MRSMSFSGFGCAAVAGLGLALLVSSGAAGPAHGQTERAAERATLEQPLGGGPLGDFGVFDGAEASVVAAPAGATASEVVLTAADVGPGFEVASSGEVVRYGVSLRTQNIVRGGRRTLYAEPDGIIAVRSLAMVAGDAGSAQLVFDQIAQGLGGDGGEVAVPAVGQRSRAFVAWGADPFDAAAKVILFRQGAVVGYVVVTTFEGPDRMDDALALARIMAERAGR